MASRRACGLHSRGFHSKFYKKGCEHANACSQPKIFGWTPRLLHFLFQLVEARPHDLPDLDAQNLLNEPLAETLPAHDFLKDEVIRKETLIK